MSSLINQSEDSIQARDLEVVEYMRQMDSEAHSIFSCKPLYDDRTGCWLNAPEKMSYHSIPEFLSAIH